MHINRHIGHIAHFHDATPAEFQDAVTEMCMQVGVPKTDVKETDEPKQDTYSCIRVVTWEMGNQSVVYYHHSRPAIEVLTDDAA